MLRCEWKLRIRECFWVSVCLTALRELHLARAEMGKVQEMLEAIQEKKEPENTSEEKVGKSIKTSSSEECLDSERFPASRTCCSIYQALIFIYVRQCETEICSLCQQDSSDADVPLDGAQARLEILKVNLLKSEREISMLMEGQEHVTDPVEQSAYARLLSAVIQQVYMSKKTLLKDTSVFCSTTWIAHSDSLEIGPTHL